MLRHYFSLQCLRLSKYLCTFSNNFQLWAPLMSAWSSLKRYIPNSLSSQSCDLLLYYRKSWQWRYINLHANLRRKTIETLKRIFWRKKACFDHAPGKKTMKTSCVVKRCKMQKRPKFGIHFLVFFPKAPANGFSQRDAAKINLSLHLHNTYYTLSSPTSSIYINFNQFHLHHIRHLHGLHLQVLTMHISPTKFLQCHLHRSSYRGIDTQEFLHRSSYTEVVTQEFYIGVATQEFYRNCCTGVGF